MYVIFVVYGALVLLIIVGSFAFKKYQELVI